MKNKYYCGQFYHSNIKLNIPQMYYMKNMQDIEIMIGSYTQQNKNIDI